MWITLWITVDKSVDTVENPGKTVNRGVEMVVRNEGQALCVAVEMERRAIRVYERALMLAKDPAVIEGIKEILSDEREHLQRFGDMKASYPVPEEEERLLISSMAARCCLPAV